jgi:hypothetical protein
LICINNEQSGDIDYNRKEIRVMRMRMMYLNSSIKYRGYLNTNVNAENKKAETTDKIKVPP